MLTPKSSPPAARFRTRHPRFKRPGAPVALVETPEWNGKITYPADLELARLVLRGRKAG
jgi:2-C-methyl-D-erythritol 4-phosphate cytidylyltransferase